MARAERKGGGPASTLSVGLVRAAAVLAGAAVPLGVFGRAVVGFDLVLVLLAILAVPGRGALVSLRRVELADPLVLALAAMLASWFVSALRSFDPGHSLEEWARSLGLLLGAVLLYRFFTAHGAAHRLALKSLVLAALAGAVLGLVGRYFAPSLLGLIRGQGWLEINSINALKAYGSVAACLMPIALWSGFRLGGAWRWAGLAYIPSALLVMRAGESHAGLFGAAVMATLMLAAALLPAGSRLYGALGLVALLLFGAIAVILLQIPPLPDPSTLGARLALAPFDLAPPASLIDPHRQMIWGFARDRAVEAPWFGRGLDVSNLLPGANTIVEAFNQEFIPSHPHNWALELFLETGAVGLVAIFAVLALLVGRLASHENPRFDRVAGLGLFGAFWGSSLFNFSFWSSWWQAGFLLLLVLVMADRRARAGTTAS